MESNFSILFDNKILIPKQSIKKITHTRDELIAVVDDNELNRFVLTQIVLKYKFKTKEAINGQEAVNLFRSEINERPNVKMLFFMDLDMPIMNGLNACLKIREIKIQNRPLIVAVTAFSSETMRQSCIDWV